MTAARLNATLTHRKTRLAVGALATALTLAACGSGDHGTTSSGDHNSSGKTGTSASADFNDADIDFAAGMIGHHRQAVEMAQMVLERGVTPAVKDLAGRIKAAQTPEIATLSGLLTTFGEKVPSAGSEHGGGHSSKGIMSPDEIERLKTLSGKDLEKAFLTDMIEHHEGAVEQATTELADGKFGAAKTLAEQIKSAQDGEITEMKNLLKQYA